jgi:Fe-S-cluster-containing hydrogenase component 2
VKFFQNSPDLTYPIKLPAAGMQPAKVLERSAFEYGQITFVDGTVEDGICLRCPDTPCIKLSADDATPDLAHNIPAYPSTAVCVFEAITLDTVTGVPQIDPETCVGCGLCAARCPTNAIRVSSKGTAEVNRKDSRVFESFPATATRELDYFRTTLKRRTRTVTQTRKISADFIEARVGRTLDILGAAPNPRAASAQHVRNLLNQLGMPARAGVTGDTNSRIDIVFKHPSGVGLCEVEFAEDPLTAVRRLLADVAVAANRYKLPKESLYPAIVVGMLPNKRSDVYEVLGDVRSYLQVEIRIVPLGALYLMTWAGAGASPFSTLPPLFLLDGQKKHVADDVMQFLAVDADIRHSPCFAAAK